MTVKRSAAPPSAFRHPLDNIRLGEFDLGGVLYHANYFHLYESAREAFLRKHQLPYPRLVEDDTHLAITESRQRFYAPVLYGRGLLLQLWTRAVGRSSVVFHYELAEQTNEAEILHAAETKLVFVRKQQSSFRPAPLPDQLRSACLAVIAEEE